MAAFPTAQPPGRFLRRYWLAFAIAAAVFAFWLLLWSIKPSQVAIKTSLIVPELFIDAPITPLKLISGTPVKEEVEIALPDGGTVVADVYHPAGGGEHGAFVLSVGAANKIRDNEGVIRLSNTLARTGVVIMVPQLYYPFKEQTLPEEVDDLVGAFSTNVDEVVASYQWLAQQPYVDNNRLGIFGISAGGGIGLIAAADQRIRSDVDFVAALGSYFDMVDLISAVTTEEIYYGDDTIDWEPRIKSVRVLHSSIISYLEDERDRDVLRRIFIDEDGSARQEVGELTDEGQHIYEAFRDKDADRIIAFWTDVSPQDMDTLREISPSTYVANLHTELFIMTDKSDPYVPYVESRRLRDAASGNGNEIHYAEFDFLNHVELSGTGDPLSFSQDFGRLLFNTWLIMQKIQ
jgi:acetyl esterase/lipase